MRRPFLALLLASVAVVAPLAACGDDDDDTAEPGATGTTAGEEAFPVTLESEAGEVTIETRPERIVSLSATATEMLFAIGSGDQVVAVDDQSDFPEEAPITDLSGYQPNIESIASYEPDLVVISYDTGDLIEGLDALGIPTLLQLPVESIEGSYDQVEELGQATGHRDEAADLVDEIQTELADLAESAPERDEPLTYYHELDPSYFTVTSDTFTAEVYEMAGLENIADAAQTEGGNVQLANEFILDEDPDFIFLADTVCCGESAATVATRQGWADLTAVQQGSVIELDDDIASRWGPRVVDFLEVVIHAVERVPVG